MAWLVCILESPTSNTVGIKWWEYVNKDWTNNSYDVDIFYDGSATTSSVLLVAKKADTPSRKRSKAAEKYKKEDVYIGRHRKTA